MQNRQDLRVGSLSSELWATLPPFGMVSQSTDVSPFTRLRPIMCINSTFEIPPLDFKKHLPAGFGMFHSNCPLFPLYLRNIGNISMRFTSSSGASSNWSPEGKTSPHRRFVTHIAHIFETWLLVFIRAPMTSESHEIFGLGKLKSQRSAEWSVNK